MKRVIMALVVLAVLWWTFVLTTQAQSQTVLMYSPSTGKVNVYYVVPQQRRSYYHNRFYGSHRGYLYYSPRHGDYRPRGCTRRSHGERYWPSEHM